MPISFTTAALGGEVEVPTLDSKVKITVKPETQSGTMMRLKGLGVRSVHSRDKGNKYCKLVVETPIKLTSKQKDLLREFEASLNEYSENGQDSKHKPKASLLQRLMQSIKDLKN